jgi:hypothetical protein
MRAEGDCADTDIHIASDIDEIASIGCFMRRPFSLAKSYSRDVTSSEPAVVRWPTPVIQHSDLVAWCFSRATIKPPDSDTGLLLIASHTF